MPKTGVNQEAPELVSSDPRWVLVQRVASSQHFKASGRLRNFLLYVSECAIREAPEDATEQQIGIHVFQRSPGYNSSEDSIVRTHARLLRQKLGEYFSGEGGREQIIIEIPKGHYLPVFRPAIPHPSATEVVPANPGEALQPQRKDLSAGATAAPAPLDVHGRRGLAWTFTISIFLLLIGGVFFWFHPTTWVPSGTDVFWRPFFSQDPSLVIYSNAMFVGDSKTGLRYATPETQPGSANPYIDTYTGIGEVASVYQLTRLFDEHHAGFILKRSLLVTWDEARLKNLIFIGSAAENPSLKVLPTTTDFTMTSGTDFAGIVNHHPKSGEPAEYIRPEHPLTNDYAILALLPGVQPGKWILILSGLTTFGTQAATEYVSRPETLAALLKAGVLQKGVIHPFEAVLQTTVAGGVPMETKLVTIRIH